MQNNTATYGVVPFENSTYGSVVYTLDLFADRAHEHADLMICDEAYLDIHHYLLGHLPPSASTSFSSSLSLQPEFSSSSSSGSGYATPTRKTPNPQQPSTRPFVSVKHIKRVYTHYQAFGQCDGFLSAYLPGVERLETASTSRAAQMVREDKTGESAALSSKAAAEVFELDILAQNVEDEVGNGTRFLVLTKSAESVESEADGIEEWEESRWKSMVGFTIDHQVPGKLADALSVFKANGLNLTSINSRPSRMRPWHYIFFVEFGGKLVRGSGNVAKALRNLEEITEGCRFYGSWRNRNPAERRVEAQV